MQIVLSPFYSSEISTCNDDQVFISDSASCKPGKVAGVITDMRHSDIYFRNFRVVRKRIHDLEKLPMTICI